MIRYRLRDDLHFCISQARSIFLDAETGRYFGLPRETDIAFQRLCAQGEASFREASDLAPMVRAGLLIASPTPFSAAPLDIAPKWQAVMSPTAATTGTHIVALAVAAQLSARVVRRKRSFASLRQAILAAKPLDDACPALRDRYHGEIAKAFAVTALFFRPAAKCLPQSVAYLSVCRTMGLNPSLVFGVRVNPFAAHCWVQHDGGVMYDTIHGARAYTPIFAL